MNMLTQEQSRVIESVIKPTDERIVAVNACAGSGKTFTSHELIKAYKPKSGFYSAFNKAIIEDSRKRFGNLIDCKTFHALAYKFVKPKKSIEDLNYSTIKEDISYEDKLTIITSIDDFFRSKESDIYEYVLTKTTDEYIQNLIISYAEMMLDGYIPPTFNYMLKCLHLMLVNKEIEIDYDLLIYDEVQDVTPVTLEIFKLINAKAKVMLGDTFQNIYSFMNTVNAFEELTDVNLLKLTKSFRCDDGIAAIVEEYGQKYLENNFVYSGSNEIQKDSTFKVAYITRTNAMLIERMLDLLNKGQSFVLTRDIKDIFALPVALLNASQGRPVYDKKYKYLEKEYRNYVGVRSNYRNYFEYIISITEDSLLKNIVKMLQNFSTKRVNIYDVKEKATDMLINNPNKNVVLTTAHAFKGLEMDNVYIEDDLNYSVNRTITKMKDLSAFIEGNPKDFLSKEQKEDLNTYYVALSRSRTKLININYIE